MTSDPRATDVLIHVEQEGANKFKIQSDQLEQIGAQLRGRRQFSIFNSIILPVIVSIATIIFSSMFQYISWINSVRLQNAGDNATRATQAYEKAATAIGKRTYITLLFFPTLRDLAKVKTPDETSVLGVDLKLNERRYESYYDQLRIWNESFDLLLTDIDYNLDRPALLQAGIAREGIRASSTKIGKIDCANSITSELDRLGLDKRSLKLQFQGINHCFIKIHSFLDAHKTSIKANTPENLDEKTAFASQSLSDIRAMANEFRCYALRRIDFYNRQKEKSILSPRTILQRFVDLQRNEAIAHFADTNERCAAERK